MNIWKRFADYKPDYREIFPELSLDRLKDVLDLTIKEDDINKLIIFLCQLSVYTEDDQFNVISNAPSSTGKTYIPIEIAKLFPKEDVVQLAHTSPTAFFHEAGTYDSSKNQTIVDLSKKIIVFLDQPHTLLLQYLRPILSHDMKEISLKITDRQKGAGLRSKNILVIGYPAVIFCTAGFLIDEQEATRFFLLSPETSQLKIKEAVLEKLYKESDAEGYKVVKESDLNRKKLKERIKAIRKEKISNIKISDPDSIGENFFNNRNVLHPRHSRDMGRITCLVKASALLNLWHREREDSTVVANDQDIVNAFELWNPIASSQELNIPPHLYNMFQEVIEPILSPEGIKRQDICKKHYQVYYRPLPDHKLRKEVLPMLEAAGKVYQDKDPNDARAWLVFPVKKNKE